MKLLKTLIIMSILPAVSAGFFDIFPSKVEKLQKNHLPTWESYCYENNSVTVQPIPSQHGMIRMNVSSTGSKHWLCMDTYLMSSLDELYVFTDNSHVDVNVSTPLLGYEYVERGLNIFTFNMSLMDYVFNTVKTSLLMLGSRQANLNFLEQNMNMTLKNNTIAPVEDVSWIQEGDIILARRLDGLDPLIMWGTGSHVGHTTIVLEINGELHVTESTDKTMQNCWPPPYGVISTPLNAWIKQARNCSMELTVLRPDGSLDLDYSKSSEFFLNHEGLSYGYHNFVFTWIDTMQSNFPPNTITMDLLDMLFLHLGNSTDNPLSEFFLEGLVQRNPKWKSQGLSTYHEIKTDLIVANESLGDYLIIPENDQWIYSNGKNMVCDVYVLNALKSAGLMSDLEWNAAEFTPRNLYTLSIYDQSWTHNVEYCKQQNTDGYCQISGQYQIQLPQFNTVVPYSNMNEKCPSLPVNYSRQEHC